MAKQENHYRQMSLNNLLAREYCNAFYEKVWSGERYPSISELSIADAYQIQDQVAELRRENGEAVVGFKIGCTSQAIRSQFGLREPICARLFSPYIFREDVHLDWHDYVNCAIEPEMVFKIGKDIKHEAPSDDQLIEAIEHVSPGIEIHNFKFWFSPPSSQELICSGGLHAGLVIGTEKVSPEELSFKNEEFRVYKDGELITKASASEIMGGPLKSLRWLANILVRRGMYLEKDSLVIPGSPVELVVITQDTRLGVEIDGLGSLITEFKKQDANKSLPISQD